MKKLLVSTILAAAAVVLNISNAFAGVIYDDPDAVPNSEYKTPYADSQFTTVYAPWLKAFHIMNENEYNQGVYGGEACQLIRSMEISPVDSNIIYFITDTSGVWKTENGGKNWYNTSNNILNTYGAGLLCDRFDKNTVYAYILEDGAYRSKNGGKTWELILEDSGYLTAMAVNKFAQDANGNVYIAAGSGIYILPKGTDSPVNLYTDYAGLTGNNGALFSDICVSDDGRNIYASCMMSGRGDGSYTPGIYVSDDAGETWKIINLFDDGQTNALSIAINPDDASNWYVSAGKYDAEKKTTSDYALYVSSDNGKSFEKRFVLTNTSKENVEADGVSFYKIRFGYKNENGVRPIYICGNQIQYPERRSDDMGFSFIPMHGRLGIGTVREGKDGGSTGWFASGYTVDMTQPDTVWFSSMGPHRWQNGKTERFSSGFSGLSLTYLVMDKEGTMYMEATDAGTFIPDGDKKYIESSYPTFKNSDTQIKTMLAIDPKNSKHLIGFSGHSNTSAKTIGIVESFDGGMTFSKVKEDAVATRNTQILMYDPNNSDIIYSSEHTSFDNGKTWEKNSEFLLDISRKNSNKRIAVRGTDAKSNELYYTEDGGETWKMSIKPGIDFVQASFDVEDDNIVWYSYLYDFGKIDLEKGIKTSYASKFEYRNFQYFRQNPKDTKHIIMTLRGGFGDMRKYSSLYETTDGGETFHAVPGLFTAGYFQRQFFSETTDEAFITGHGGTFIYDYNKFREYLDSKIKVIYNDKEVTLSVMPRIESDDVYVPVRDIFELAGADVSWDSPNQTATTVKRGKRASFVIGNNIANCSGKIINMVKAPYIRNDKMIVSLKAAAEMLGLDIGWDNEESLIVIKDLSLGGK